MSQRDSGYARHPDDHYVTPAWVTHALRGHLSRHLTHVWEPACGDGQMVAALGIVGHQSIRQRRHYGTGFLQVHRLHGRRHHHQSALHGSGAVY